MREGPDVDDRLLSLAEREMVAQAAPDRLVSMSREELQALGKRLRSARDRSRRIASRQQREIRGKAEPHGATPARDNAGSVGKTAVLIEALAGITQALRRLRAPSQAELGRKLLAMKQAAPTTRHPGAGRTRSQGMTSKPSQRNTVQVDPREVGRVSQAVKVGQARRDK